MSLAAGAHLGPYEIVALIGSGGMGEVYHARDTRLGRSVALKVLRGDASDPDRRARLRQEARAIASLSHAHICTLHDVDFSDDSEVLVMELLRGETLQARLRRGPMPLKEVLQRGAEIADALHFAHRAGVLHRDLKPGNVMLTPAGAKLLDFGLARMTRPIVPASGRSAQGTTESVPLTGEGIAVGTIDYMSPEQLEARPPDARSDIWSLGVTLFEALSAKRPFESTSTVGLVTAIMREEPRLSELPANLPASVRRVLQRCLAKDPETRWQDAGDLADELRWIEQESSGARDAASSAASTPRTKGVRGSRRWLAYGVLALAIAALAWWRGTASSPPGGVVRTQIIPPDVAYLPREYVALSPDGKCLALVMTDSSGDTRLGLRRLDGMEMQWLGPRGASAPIWSPDSRQLAFLTAEGKLVKQSIAGGAPQTICAAPNLQDGAWGADHWIVFGGLTGPLYKVKDTGGVSVPATALDTTRHESVHGYPCFLPDGRHFTYLTSPSLAPSSNRVRVATTAGRESWDLMTVHHAPVCDGRGWLVFMRDRALLAQRVDRSGRHLLGDPIPMVETPERSGMAADPIAMVGSGVLVYRPLDDQPCDISWYSRAGAIEQRVAREPFVVAPTISPDGRRAMVRGVEGDETWLVRVDLASGETQRLTSTTEWNSWPAWDATGRDVLYSTGEIASAGSSGRFFIRRMDPEHPGSNTIVCSAPTFIEPEQVSPDGRFLVVGAESTNPYREGLRLFELGGPDTTRPLFDGTANENCFARIGGTDWFAYASDESGRYEIYADRFPGLGHRVKLTRAGCGWEFSSRHYLWTAGDEVFYFAPDSRTLRTLRVRASANEIQVLSDQPLFTVPLESRGICPSPDGRRLLMVTAHQPWARVALTVVQNWQQGLVRTR